MVNAKWTMSTLDRHNDAARGRLVKASQEAIARAAETLRAGGLVAFPTETVYGLGADARNGEAVARLFAAKGRPRFNPLIVHVADFATAATFVHLGEVGERLANAFWPGPLTLVVPLRAGAGISALVTAGLDTLAVRVPAHPIAQGLLEAAAIPVAAPSANPSGRTSPTRAGHVAAGLGDKVDLILDGGPCAVGLESTILKLGEGCDGAQLLRPGGLARADIEKVLGEPLLDAEPHDRPAAPGQLASHYAPAKPVRLNATHVEAEEALLAFGEPLPQGAKACVMVRNLSRRGDLVEAAANLFQYLHEVDATKAKGIAVMPIPTSGLGEAINDRLGRAAAPRGGLPS
jgi:L-threonylcarbamoyladenylate synthase